MQRPPQTSKSSRILIVEDEIILAKELERSLSNLGYEVIGWVGTAQEAVSMADERM